MNLDTLMWGFKVTGNEAHQREKDKSEARARTPREPKAIWSFVSANDNDCVCVRCMQHVRCADKRNAELNFI